jgi:hypothetical protein
MTGHADDPKGRELVAPEPLGSVGGPFDLIAELAAGRLDPQIGVSGSLWEPDEALTALMDRRVRGKAVLTAR